MDDAGTHSLTSLVPPEKSTARAKATSRTMKKPVTPQKALAMMFDMSMYL